MKESEYRTIRAKLTLARTFAIEAMQTVDAHAYECPQAFNLSIGALEAATRLNEALEALDMFPVEKADDNG